MLLNVDTFAWLAAALTLTLLPHLPHLPVGFWLLFPAAVAWSGRVVQGRRQLPPRWLLTAITLATIAGVLLHYRTLFGRDAGTALLAAMVSLKFLELRTLRDGMVLIFLGYFLVMAVLLYEQTLPLAAYLLLVVIVLLTAQIALQHPTALPPARLLRCSSRLVAEAIPIMLILFILFPRVPGPLWGLPRDAYSGLTGLSEEMTPGSISQLSLSDAVAFRVRFDGPIPPASQLYWRGPVLWRYDGRTWRRWEETTHSQFSVQVGGAPVDYTITLQPHGSRWLPALDMPVTLPPDAGITSSLQLVPTQPVNQVLRYAMRSYPQYNTGPLPPGQDWTSLPARFDPRARALAQEWRQRYTAAADIVTAALALFRQEPFYYTLNPPLLQSGNAIDEFLFTTRRGFCEHYAGSFVFLLRAAGVPARVVLGYQGGERNDLGGYLIVRQADAHAWAEVWLQERGWVRVDPTAAVAPARIERGLYAALDSADNLSLRARRDSVWLYNLAMTWDYLNNAWNDWVLAYGPERQKQFLSALGFGPLDWRDMTVALLLALAGVSLALFGWQTLWNRAVRDPVARAYRDFCAKLARRGYTRAAHEGPLAFSERVALSRPDLAEQVRLIGQLYASLRYGRRQPTAAVRQLRRLVRQFRV